MKDPQEDVERSTLCFAEQLGMHLGQSNQSASGRLNVTILSRPFHGLIFKSRLIPALKRVCENSNFQRHRREMPSVTETAEHRGPPSRLLRAFSARKTWPTCTWADGPAYYISRPWRWNAESWDRLQRAGLCSSCPLADENQFRLNPPVKSIHARSGVLGRIFNDRLRTP